MLTDLATGKWLGASSTLPLDSIVVAVSGDDPIGKNRCLISLHKRDDKFFAQEKTLQVISVNFSWSYVNDVVQFLF